MNSDIGIIVGELHASGKLKSMVSHFRFVENPQEDRELKKDLEQEVILLLLEYKKSEKLIRLYARGEIEGFVFGTIKHMIFDNRRRVWVKNYRDYFSNKAGIFNEHYDYTRTPVGTYREGIYA